MMKKNVTKTAPREGSAPHNGLPESVPYVYRHQKRHDAEAARIARRDAQGWWKPLVLPAP